MDMTGVVLSRRKRGTRTRTRTRTNRYPTTTTKTITTLASVMGIMAVTISFLSLIQIRQLWLSSSSSWETISLLSTTTPTTTNKAGTSGMVTSHSSRSSPGPVITYHSLISSSTSSSTTSMGLGVTPSSNATTSSRTTLSTKTATKIANTSHHQRHRHDRRRHDRHPRLHVVVAYCRMSLDWIFQEFLNVNPNNPMPNNPNIQTTTQEQTTSTTTATATMTMTPLDRIATIWIYSKCHSSSNDDQHTQTQTTHKDDMSKVIIVGEEEDDDGSRNRKNDDEVIRNVTNFFKQRQQQRRQLQSSSSIHHHHYPQIIVRSLDNVGRCDHTYAYWIRNVLVPNIVVNDDDGDDDTTTTTTTTINGTTGNNRGIQFHLDDEVLFIKDNNSKDHLGDIQLNTFHEMEQLVYNRSQVGSAYDDYDNRNRGQGRERGRGFGCATKMYVQERYWKSTRYQRDSIIDSQSLGDFYLQNYSRDFHISHSHHHNAGTRTNATTISTAEADDDRSDHESTIDESLHIPTAEPFESPYRPLRRYVEAMKIHVDLGQPSPPRRTPSRDSNEIVKTRPGVETEKQLMLRERLNSMTFTPICYCGSFLTTVKQIQNAPVDDWTPIVQSLSRGDNIEEGHYMERLWAALLSKPLTELDQERLRKQVVLFNDDGIPYLIPTQSTHALPLFRYIL